MDQTATPRKGGAIATFVVVSIALFMTTLDNLVVSTALPNIREGLQASLEDLQWTVNAYTVSFAVLLLLGSALGDRFGRKRMFIVGLTLFTVASALAAISTTADALIAARGLQGIGAALVTPLTLTLLASVLPADKRGAAIGAWSAIGGAGVALGPVIGGLVVENYTWHWIFWINVPIGLVLIPLSLRFLNESHGPSRQLDVIGVLLSAVGLLGLVLALVRGNEQGWASSEVIAEFIVGAVFLTAFVIWELRNSTPMLPMQFFAKRSFTGVILVNVIMFFGVFGSVFLLSQYFQTAQGLSPMQAGLRVLPWTAAPLIVAPIAGVLSQRYGARPFLFFGLLLQGIGLLWIGTQLGINTPYSHVFLPFLLAGSGMGLIFAPAATAVLASVDPKRAGQASGAMNALREVGGVLGVSLLAAVFAANGSYVSPEAFVDGVRPAVFVGAVIVIVGSFAAWLMPRNFGVGVDPASELDAEESVELRPEPVPAV